MFSTSIKAEWQHLKCTFSTDLPDDKTVWFGDKYILT